MSGSLINFSKDARIKLETVTKIQISCSAVSLSFLLLSNRETTKIKANSNSNILP